MRICTAIPALAANTSMIMQDPFCAKSISIIEVSKLNLRGTFIVNIQVESTLSTDRHRVRALFSVRTDEAGV
jgi:hypothetical protein